ncbi:hypothetical protein OsI_29791 [Oryza sativa Indica Group]|jgi:hypothetical protein|uniref:Uncharacterized protein n=4 Tax=Oryza TaxID=4527 RepID=Q6ZFH2_ORYSJ|nr:hypothetical protein OsI_29791 [Oryza sativa Indica Group]BAD08821.1 hypothetical protein [Oryza sativa Japonica Group]BAD09283.1 hypothetical protein [Oryza sativa Japonica Group]
MDRRGKALEMEKRTVQDRQVWSHVAGLSDTHTHGHLAIQLLHAYWYTQAMDRLTEWMDCSFDMTLQTAKICSTGVMTDNLGVPHGKQSRVERGMVSTKENFGPFDWLEDLCVRLLDPALATRIVATLLPREYRACSL